MAIMGELLPPPAEKKKLSLQQTTPEFTLEGRKPNSAGKTVPEAAADLLNRCYAAVTANRANLIELVKAVYANDTPTIDRIRHQGAKAGVELLADAYYTAFQLAAKD